MKTKIHLTVPYLEVLEKTLLIRSIQMKNNSRQEQILRIAFVSLTGGMLLLIQRSIFEKLFEAQIITEIVTPNPPSCPENPTFCSDLFIRYSYTPSAIIIYIISFVSSLLWYYTALKLEPYFSPRDDTSPARLKWGTFLLFPLLSILGTVYFYGSISPQALPFLCSFFIFDVAWIYWQATAMSTPLIVSPIIPWSQTIRDFWRIKN